MEELIIDEELAGLHRNLSPLELEQLERNCIADGAINDPIMVWGVYVLDGRHRLPIAKANGLSYEIKQVDLPDRESAKLWVMNNQLGKRNLSDFECTRIRAEKAKVEGTLATAQAAGVSQRTVQRDLEADSARNLMSSDIREKCERGAIVNSKRALKDYSELNDHQRNVVDTKLREDGGLTLQQAIPALRVTLTPADFKAINESVALSATHKQRIMAGSISADSKSVEAFFGMPVDIQRLIAELLNDKDIDSLGDAILNYKNATEITPVTNGDKIEKVSSKIRKVLEDALCLLDDLKALKADKSGHGACSGKVKEAMEAFDAWR